MKGFVAKISGFIAHHQLLDPDKRYLVALSGGADSVCLLLVLQQLGYKLEAVHCNFHLRGDESDRDEQFCEALCKDKNIPFHRVHFDTRTYAEVHGVSIEMAARELRYHYFYQLLQSIDAEAVCVAHHRDDIVETVLINLLRGTGLRGLTGIAASGALPTSSADQKARQLLRPLLAVGREEILQYLDSVGQDYVTDSTNLQDDVLRNKIRLHALPLLREISPAASTNIARTAQYLALAEPLFDEAIERRRAEALVVDETDDFVVFSLEKLLDNEYFLYECLRPYGFTSAQVESISCSAFSPGQQWLSPTHTAAADRGTLVVFRNDHPRLGSRLQPRKMPIEGTYDLGPMGRYSVVITEQKSSISSDRKLAFPIDKSPSVACLDADKVSFPLTLRPIAEGDRFRPFGMRGSKLVSDYLTDLHCSLFEKCCQLALTDETGEILWLVGRRTCQQAAVTSETRRLLKVSLLEC